MSRYDYRDPGQDPDYCNGLAPEEPYTSADLTVLYERNTVDQAMRMRIRAETVEGLEWLTHLPVTTDGFVEGWTLFTSVQDGLGIILSAIKAGLQLR